MQYDSWHCHWCEKKKLLKRLQTYWLAFVLESIKQARRVAQSVGRRSLEPYAGAAGVWDATGGVWSQPSRRLCVPFSASSPVGKIRKEGRLVLFCAQTQQIRWHPQRMVAPVFDKLTGLKTHVIWKLFFFKCKNTNSSLICGMNYYQPGATRNDQIIHLNESTILCYDVFWKCPKVGTVKILWKRSFNRTETFYKCMHFNRTLEYIFRHLQSENLLIDAKDKTIGGKTQHGRTEHK